MKKIFCIITAFFIALTAFKFSAFAETLALNKTNIDLPVDYFTAISVSGAKGNVEWFSGNKNVAAVEPRDGISADIIGIGEGETYIYAKADGKTLKCMVTVRQAFISVSNKAPELYIGETKTIKLAVSGSQKISIKNSNKEVCSASWGKWDNGKISLTVKAKAEGTAKITVYIKEHASTTSETMTVKVNGTEIISLESDSDKDYKVSPIKDVFPVSQRASESYEKLCGEMKKVIEKYPFECAVSVYNLEKGYLFQHNTNKYLPGASTIKLIYAYHCCTQIEQGKHTLDETVTYLPQHDIVSGSEIQKYGHGTKFSVKTLLDYSIRNSDNVAYYMLVDTFGKTDFNKMIRNWGYTSQLGSSNYPAVSSELLNTAMLKIHDKAVSSKDESWKIVWEALLKSTYSEIRKEIDYCNTAVKYGLTYGYYNEVCYVDSKSPYIIVIMSQTSSDNVHKDGDEIFFKTAAYYADKINTAYETA